MGLLELTGAARRRSAASRLHPLATGLALATSALAIGAARAEAVTAPRPVALRCVEACAGRQTAAVGSTIAIAGDRLSAVAEVRFRAHGGPVAVEPSATGRSRLTVSVPAGALGGRPRLADARGRTATVPKLLRIVDRSRLPGRDSFRVAGAKVTPRHGFVDDGRTRRLRYRFRAYGTRAVRITLMHRGDIARSWRLRGLVPYTTHRVAWRGLLPSGRPAPPGRYRFEVSSPRHEPVAVGGFRLRGGEFPVRGAHGYGGPVQRFGAPRSGGRVHEGQDVFAACGTPVVAARGGRVQARGSDPALYGNWVVIDARGTSTDYRYAHFLRPATVRPAHRVHTGDRIGRIGRTGNARSVGCQLHFEIWPHGWNRGGPIDPLPILRRWDGWS